MFMPEAFGGDFSQFLHMVFPVVIEGLADPIGPVRDVALKAGQGLECVLLFSPYFSSSYAFL